MQTTAAVYGRATRGTLVFTALALAGTLATARLLEPAPQGRGTHQALGLPACVFASQTGRPCPGCGITTALAWMTRGRVDQAFLANPAGCVLAPACAALALWLLHSAVSGRPRWGARSLDFPLALTTVVTVTVGLAAWTVRLLILGRV